jgi:predicted peptidase
LDQARDPTDQPLFCVHAQCPSDKRWVEVDWKEGHYDFKADGPSETMALAITVFNKILKEKPIDRSKIYVCGASMGGYGTWDFAMRHADILAAAVPACGGGDPNHAALLKDLPIWAFHGDKDTTVPLKGSTDMIDAIKAAGGQKARLTIYPRVAHDSWNMFWKEPEMIKWLFSQSR